MPQMRRSIAAAVAVLASLAATSAADAHQSPPGCGTNAAHVDLTGTDINIIHRNGDHISVVPKVSNNSPNACDVTDAKLTIRFPKSDGTPGPEQVVATGIDLPAGTTPTALPAVEHTIDLDPGVFRAPVKAQLSGTFHWIGTHSNSDLGGLEVPLSITRPHASIAVTPSPAMGDAPLSVTYAYAVTNDSPHDPNPGAADPNMTSVALTDDRCGIVPPAHTGDTNMNDVIEPGETWVYHCTTTLSFGGVFENHVSLEAMSTRDGRPWPAATGTGSVTVNGPDMTLAGSHTGDFARGDKGRTYSLVARNSGDRPATGPVSVTDTLPAGLTATAIGGQGWDCTLASLTCSRNDTLAAGQSYPPIAVTVDVAGDAPASVVNTASVTRAGENPGNDTTSDPTTITPPQAKPGPTGDDPAGGSGHTPGDQPGDQPGTGEQPRQDQRTGDDTPPRDVTAPSLAGLRLTNRVFAVSSRRGPEGARRPRPTRGTAFVYSLSEAARVEVTISRRTVGRRSAGKCAKTTRATRNAKRCARYVPVGSFDQTAAVGVNSKRWAGRIGSKLVGPGSYRAQVVAVDAAGNRSTARTLSFRVVSP